MFLRVARSVYENWDRKLAEVPDAQDRREIIWKMTGMREVIRVLADFQRQLIQEARPEEVDWSEELSQIAGRLILTQKIRFMQKKVMRQRKELKRLNRDNGYLRSRLRYDLCTMEDAKSRWTMLNETSPSGKQLFCCRVCGRISITPDRGCKTIADPHESLGCSKWPKHPKMMTDKARWVEAVAALEEAMALGDKEGSKRSAWDRVEYAYDVLVKNRDIRQWRAADNGARELGRIVEEELVAYSSDPQQEQRIEKLIELCGEVRRGKFAGQAWGQGEQ